MIDKGQWWEFGQDTGVTPLLFTRSAMGFWMTTESQDLGLTSHLKDVDIMIVIIIVLQFVVIMIFSRYSWYFKYDNYFMTNNCAGISNINCFILLLYFFNGEH